MPVQAPFFDALGERNGEVDLPSAIFEETPNMPVMHQAYLRQMANARQGTASTKTRATVRGGGAKPYRQKGTGRARHGSTREPSMKGGATVFGPKPRDYAQRMPKQMRRLALRSALSQKAIEERIRVIESFVFDEPKTKQAQELMDAIGVREPRPRQDRAGPKPEPPRHLLSHVRPPGEGFDRAAGGELQPARQARRRSRGSRGNRAMTTRAASEIVIGPLITERTYQLYTQGRYTFKVSARASKTEIKKALEEQYESQSIQVKKINTVHMRGKTRRSFRRVGSGTVGKSTDWKKAIVTLGEGQKIEGLFGSV